MKTFRVAYRTFGPFETALRREWTSFQRSTGCDLTLELTPLDHHPLYEGLFEEEGLRRGAWDVATINTDWVAEARESAALLDLAPFIARRPPDDYPAGWTPSLLRLQQFGNETIGLPYHDGPECFIYRTDLFTDPAERRVYEERFGEPLAVPQTWEAFVRVAHFFNRPEKNLFGTVFAAYPDGHNTVYDICLQLWTRGGELFDDAGAMQLDTPAMAEALGFYRAVVNDPAAVHPDVRAFDSVKSGAAFARGEVAMMINWFGFAAMCETVPESKVKGRVAVASIPHAPGAASASLNCYWMLGVAAGSQHRETAYEFVRSTASAANDKARTLEGVIGCRRSTWTDDEVNEVIPFYREMGALHADARELPRLTNWVDLSAVVDRAVLRAIDTDDPIAVVVRDAQAQLGNL